MRLTEVEWNSSTYGEFVEYLLSLRSERYLQFHQKLVPTVNNLIGIQVPVLRKLAKELKRSDLKQFLQFVRHDYYEENMIHGFVVGELCKDKSIALEEKLQYVKDFVPYIDNWAVCDSFCSTLKIAVRYPKEFLGLIEEFLRENKEYYKRFGFVMLLFHYVDEQYMPRIFEYCSQYNNDDEYYVQMAVAWLLSMCYVKEREATLKYLRLGQLDEFTYRKTINKILESNQVSKEEKVWVRNNLRR